MPTAYETELVIGGDSSGAKGAVQETMLYLDRLARTYKVVSDVGVNSADKTAASYDRLRKTIDPLYATSKRYEAAVRTLQAAKAQLNWTDAEYEAQLEQTAAAMGFLETKTLQYNSAIKLSRFHTANIFAQLNDIGVMMASGQSPFILAIQQGSQLNQIFASLGNNKAIFPALLAGVKSMINPMALLTIGTIAAGAALYQFVANALSAEEEVSALKEVTETLTDETQELADKLFLAASGYETLAEAKTAEQITTLLAEINRLTILKNEADVEGKLLYEAQLIELEEQLAMHESLLEEKLKLAQQDKEQERRAENFVTYLERAVSEAEKLTQLRVDYIYNLAVIAIEQAEEEQKKLNELTEMWEKAIAKAEAEAAKLEEEIGAAGVAALRLAGVDIANPISEAVKEAAALAGYLNIALSDAISLQNLRESKGYSGRGEDPRRFMPGGDLAGQRQSFEYTTVDDILDEGSKRGGGGGRKKTDELQQDLERLRESLKTELELELQSYQERQLVLEEALAQKKLTLEEYYGLSERLNQEHQDKMSAIDVYRYGTGLEKMEAFLGDMASALSSGNEEMLKISKIFGAAQALISAWQGAAEALKLPFPQNLIAFAKVLATGLQAVQAIKSVGKGGTGQKSLKGGGGGQTIAAGPAAPPKQQISLTLIGQSFDRASVIQLAEAINSGTDNGLVIRGRR